MSPVKKKIKDADVEGNPFEERTESFIRKNWEPNDALIDQANEYGISKPFVLSQLDEFIHLHREKSDTSHSWEIKFLRFVIKNGVLRKYQTSNNRKESPWINPGNPMRKP